MKRINARLTQKPFRFGRFKASQWTLVGTLAKPLLGSLVTAFLTTGCSYPSQLTDLSDLVSISIGDSVQAQTAVPMDWAGVEQDLLAEHNRVRQNPQSYVPILQARLESMNQQGNIPNGCGRNCTLTTQEGQAAVEEAIRYLNEQPAVGPLTLSDGIARAAKSHANDQRDGALGHSGSNGSSPLERVSGFDVETSGVGENIAYGPETAQDVVMNLIVDDGVADRGHRINLFQAKWTMAGAGCGPHSGYGSVCVIDYAGAPRGAAVADRQFEVVNKGTVDLLSLKVAGGEVLGAALPVGKSRSIPLDAASREGCKVDLSIQMGGNYLPLDWNDLDLCLATLTIDEQNNFRVEY